MLKNLEVEIIKSPTESDWAITKLLALTTMGNNEVRTMTPQWKNMILKSEHSPIRTLEVIWRWYNLPSWVSTHFVRHKIGIEHFVQSQRNDRQPKYDRNYAPQSYPVLHACRANVQAIINISKVRLCNKASKETTYAWNFFLNELAKVNPEIVSFCVPTCVYRGGICPEPRSCGYNNTEAFVVAEEQYLKTLKGENE